MSDRIITPPGFNGSPDGDKKPKGQPRVKTMQERLDAAQSYLPNNHGKCIQELIDAIHFLSNITGTVIREMDSLNNRVKELESAKEP